MFIKDNINMSDYKQKYNKLKKRFNNLKNEKEKIDKMYDVVTNILSKVEESCETHGLYYTCGCGMYATGEPKYCEKHGWEICDECDCERDHESEED